MGSGSWPSRGRGKGRVGRKFSPLLSVFFLVLGCAVTPRKPVPDRYRVPREVMPGLWEASRFLRLDMPRKALSIAEDLISKHPFLVEAHRVKQEAMKSLFLHGSMMKYYHDFLEANRGRPEPYYLLGRISRPLARRRKLFRLALETDPFFPRALGALGLLEDVSGNRERAEELIRKAIYISPETKDFHLMLAEILKSRGKEAMEKAFSHLEAARRLDPLDPLPLLAMAEYSRGLRAVPPFLAALDLEPRNPEIGYTCWRIAESGGKETRACLLAALEGKENSLPAPALFVLAWLRLEAGDQEGALQVYERLMKQGVRLPPDQKETYASLLIGKGRTLEALKVLDHWMPRGYESRWKETIEAFLSGRERDGEKLVIAMASSGRWRAASALLRQKGCWKGDHGKEAEKAVAGARRLEIFEGIIKSNVYGRRDGKAKDLRTLLGNLARASVDVFGTDIVGKPRIVYVSGLGGYVDPMGPGLPAYFRKRGRLLILGQKLGKPPEGLSGEIAGERDEVIRSPGRTRRVHCFLIEGKGMKPRTGIGDLAGLAIDDFYVIDLEAIAQWANSIRKNLSKVDAREVLEDPVFMDVPSLGMDFPCGLAMKLKILGSRRAKNSLEEDLFEITRMHELAHLGDAMYFLPVTSNLCRISRLLIKCGISVFRVKAELERRAQICAIAYSRNPLLALAQASEALEADYEYGDPHILGYELLVLDMARKARELGVLRGGNVVAELFKLRPSSLRRLAKLVMKDLEIPPLTVSYTLSR